MAAKLGFALYVVSVMFGIGLIVSLFAVPAHSGANSFYQDTGSSTTGVTRISSDLAVYRSLSDVAPTGVRFMPAWAGFVLMVFILCSLLSVASQELFDLKVINAFVASGLLMSSGFVLGLTVYFASLIHLIGQSRAPEVFASVVVFGGFYLSFAFMASIALLYDHTSLLAGSSKRITRTLKPFLLRFCIASAETVDEKTPAAPSAPVEAYNNENEA